MKITFLLFCIILLSFISSSQNFAPLGATWYYGNKCMYDTTLGDCGFYKIIAYSDTMIEGKYCTLIGRTMYDDTTVIDINSSMAIYENEKRVYFYENNSFKLFYDFNLLAGDTLKFHRPYLYNYYDQYCSGGEDEDTANTAVAVVEYAGDTIINGIPLRYQQFLPLLSADYNDTLYTWHLGTVIEKSGSVRGLFGVGYIICLVALYSNELMCYHDDAVDLNFVDYACNKNIGLISDLSTRNNSDIKLFPTITSNFFNIQLPGNIIADKIIVIHTNGQHVREINYTSTIDISDLPVGIYFVGIITEGRIIFSKPVMKISGS